MLREPKNEEDFSMGFYIGLAIASILGIMLLVLI